MNIVIDHNTINLNNIFFNEKKKNIIVDGTFSKIIYSNEHFSSNGIYIFCPMFNIHLNKKSGHSEIIHSKSSQKLNSGISELGNFRTKHILKNHMKRTLDIDINNASNLSLFQNICSIEDGILKHYKYSQNINKHSTYTLKNQIVTGTINISNSDYDEINDDGAGGIITEPKYFVDDFSGSDVGRQYILKISGVWETHNTIGITYKFIRMHSFTDYLSKNIFIEEPLNIL